MIPIDIKLLQKSRVLEITYANGQQFSLPCEYLRVFSPSAEVQGHGGTPMPLVVGKENINIISVEPVGHYAIKLTFDDGHNTGLYSWETLHQLATHYEENWQNYLKHKS